MASPKAAAAPLATTAPKFPAFVRTFSVANRERGALDACIDFTIRLEQPSGGTADWASKNAPDLRALLANLGTELRKPCAEQFTDRLVLATCAAVTKREGQELELLERYYNPDTVGMDDLHMQACRRLGGTWQAVAKDSPEFRKAAAEAKIRALESLVAGSG